MYFLDRIMIKSKLVATFIVITIALVFFGSFILIEMDTLGNLTTTLYEHPLRVSNAAQSAHKGVLRIHGLMKDMISSKKGIELQGQMDRIQQIEKEVLAQLNIVRKYIIGEQGRELEADARRTFLKWKSLRLEIVSLLKAHKLEEAQQKFQLANAETVEVIELNMQDLTAYARNKADGFMSDANTVRKNIILNTVLLLGLLVLFFYFVSSTLIKHITGRINDLQSTIYKIAESGNFKEIPVIGDNELSKLAVSFNDLIRSLSSQLWLREGLNKLNIELTGASSPLLLAESVLKFLSNHMRVSTGAFFIYDEEKKSSSMLASYAMAESNEFSREFADGDGVVGQVAKERRPKILTIVTRDEGLVQSGTVATVPNTLFVSPLLFGDKLIGVLEVTSFHEFRSVEQSFMKTACHNIATSLSNIFQREEIDALYAETRVQNVELFNAGEKARKAAEEIELRNKELRIRSEELKLQANLLSSQKKELEIKQVQVEAADRLKSEFLSNMSHELRTPLNSILALSQLMQIKGTGNNVKKEAEYLQVIERNGKHLLSLINDILDLSKIESGRMDYFPVDFSPAELLEEVSTTIRPMAERKSLSFITKIDYYQSMFSDRDKIRQILLNLMSNAVKFSDEGTIQVELTTEGEQLLLNVKDTGIGIAVENQEAIFDEFRQVDGSTSRKHEGTGLGLAICKKLANLLEGDLKVVSELGSGSTFTLRLPLRSSHGQTMSDPGADNFNGAEHFLNTVLVVDDDPNSREVVMKHLVKAGYGVLEADNGKRALEIAAKHSLVGIILDIFMPGMDGWETLSLLKNNPSTRDIPVIIVSVSNDSTTGYVLGASAHLTKPVDKEQLLKEMSKFKGQKSSQRQRVLIVDDEENDRMLLSNTLQEAGYDTIEADRGQAGIDKAVSLLPDVMTLDLLMPEMDGFQMLEEISKLPQLSYLPVIVITAKDLSKGEHQKLLERSRAIVQKGDLGVKVLLQKLENELDGLTQYRSDPRYDVKVLVIEDNDIATMQIARLLKELCFSMSHAASFQEAVQLAQQIAPDLIILDLMISSFNVFKIFEAIRSESETENVPVIVLTGKDLTGEIQAVLKNRNVRQFNRKEPLDRELLKELILQSVDDGSKPVSINLSGQNPTATELPDDSFNQPFGKGKVLVVVEDNEDNVVTLKAILEDFQGKIHFAYDGESGLKIINEIRPDLVLMDIQLPGMSGLEVTAAVKKSLELKHIPVIAVTARAMKNDKEKIMEAGCDGLLTKPYDVENLRKILLKWLML